MPEKTVVLCTVALTPELVGEATPRLQSFASGGAMVPVGGVTPAVTATVQSTYLTGQMPSGHGAVGNGWLFRDTMEVRLWQQSNRLVQAPKVWEASPGHHLREPVVVVRDVLVGRRHGDAAADVPGRRQQDPGLLHEAGRPA